MSWDLFHGLFDFNGDGKTDFIEEAIGFSILDQAAREENDDDEEEDDE